MIRKTEDALHREQRILWKMKALFTEFRGDAVWAPVGMFHTEFDDVLLGTHRMSASSATLSTNLLVTEGAAGSAVDDAEPDTSLPEQPAEDVPMTDDAAVEGRMVTAATNGAIHTADAAPERARRPAGHTTNGDGPHESSETHDISVANGTMTEPPDAPMLDPTAEPSDDTLPNADGDNDSSAPSHRMTTRARAHEPTHSPTPSFGSPQIHPFFAFPSTAIPDANLGLPIHMADETRHALISYISKQEEIVRSYTEIHAGLLKSLEMRTNVLNWTKAEGHDGEMSDHEDWVDLERWGIERKDFRKGMVEDDGDEAVEEERRKRVPRVGRGRAAAKD
jgi:hypothetical protein